MKPVKGNTARGLRDGLALYPPSAAMNKAKGRRRTDKLPCIGRALRKLSEPSSNVKSGQQPQLHEHESAAFNYWQGAETSKHKRGI